MEEKANIVVFHKKSIQNNFKSKEAGRPIFEDQDYIEIRVLGSRDIVDRPVRAQDKENYSRQWDAYQNSQEQTVQGTPLREWGKLTQARVKEFESLNVHTVEQLIEIADVNIKKFGSGIRELQAQAKDYIELSQNENLVAELKAENKKLKTSLTKLENKFKEFEKKESKAA